ncbi:MAG: esterase/lipase family protein [Desulfovibrionaceae bacterium]
MWDLLTVLFIALCLGVGFVSVVSTLFVWYEAGNSDGPDGARALREQFGPPLKLALRECAMSLASQMLVALTYPLGLVPRLWPSRPRPGQASPQAPPVLLVHGLYHNPAAWIVWRWYLRRAGYHAVYSFAYNSITRDFDAIAADLARCIAAIHAAHHHAGVRVVGHSLGGLLARACASRPEARDALRAVVTLGSPHQGSKLAALAVFRLGRSLVFRGALIQALEERESPPACPCLSLYSPVDNMVTPDAGRRIGTPGWTETRTAPLNHISLLFAPSVARAALAFLAQAPSRPSGA